MKITNLQSESYRKRINILIHGIEESGAWERKEETRKILDNFFENALHLTHGEISLVDYHRLPQRSIYRKKEEVTKPIIIKVPTIFEKQTISY